MEELELSIEDYKRKYSISRHQLSLMYKEFEDEKIVYIFLFY